MLSVVVLCSISNRNLKCQTCSLLCDGFRISNGRKRKCPWPTKTYEHSISFESVGRNFYRPHGVLYYCEFVALFIIYFLTYCVLCQVYLFSFRLFVVIKGWVTFGLQQMSNHCYYSCRCTFIRRYFLSLLCENVNRWLLQRPNDFLPKCEQYHIVLIRQNTRSSILTTPNPTLNNHHSEIATVLKLRNPLISHSNSRRSTLLQTLAGLLLATGNVCQLCFVQGTPPKSAGLQLELAKAEE